MAQGNLSHIPPAACARPPHSSPFWNHLLGSGDKEASSPLLRSKARKNALLVCAGLLIMRLRTVTPPPIRYNERVALTRLGAPTTGRARARARGGSARAGEGSEVAGGGGEELHDRTGADKTRNEWTASGGDVLADRSWEADCEKMLRRLMRHADAIPFLEPVDHVAMQLPGESMCHRAFFALHSVLALVWHVKREYKALACLPIMSI